MLGRRADRQPLHLHAAAADPRQLLIADQFLRLFRSERGLPGPQYDYKGAGGVRAGDADQRGERHLCLGRRRLVGRERPLLGGAVLLLPEAAGADLAYRLRPQFIGPVRGLHLRLSDGHAFRRKSQRHAGLPLRQHQSAGAAAGQPPRHVPAADLPGGPGDDRQQMRRLVQEPGADPAAGRAVLQPVANNVVRRVLPRRADPRPAHRKLRAQLHADPDAGQAGRAGGCVSR